MKLEHLFTKKECVFALEVFPPKKQSSVESVYGTLEEMAKLPVDYISVTYSAGGNGAKEYTAQIAKHLKDGLNIVPLAHLTCVNSKRDEIAQELAALRVAGIGNILALRGDLNPSVPKSTDYAHASDLMRAIMANGSFYVAGACYPEGHPESPNLATDIDRLQNKIEAGAGHFVSQLFFDNGKFFRFLNLARKKGISCPVEAGVMPIIKKEQIARTILLSSASIPAEFSKIVSLYADDPASFYDAGIDYSIRQIRDLIEGGVDGVHLYAMNNAVVAQKIYNGIADLLP